MVVSTGFTVLSGQEFIGGGGGGGGSSTGDIPPVFALHSNRASSLWLSDYGT